jgi:ankyrin repeat protein
VVKTLVELGADLHIRSTPRPRRIHTRTAGFNPAGVIDVVQGGFTALLFATRSGDLEIATHLVGGGADVNDTSLSGTSALVVAAHSGHTALATFLLEQGADPNAADAGYAALHTATLRGDQALVKALLARGADPDAPVQRGSPGRRNSPDYVLEHDVVGATSFWLAARFAEPDIMQILRDNGATSHLVMPDGTTPLMAATRARRRSEPGLTANPVEEERRILKAVQLAIEEGIDLNQADESGNAPLHTAASRRLDSVIQLLVENGATIDIKNEDGQTPLALAARRNIEDNSTVELLRRLGAAGD